MYRRKCYDKLLEWKRDSCGRSALLIEGARRVGKTTLVREFARREYAASIYIDFSVAGRDTLNLFRDGRDDVDTFLRTLQLLYGTKLPERDGLVIFDEVQRFPLAREYVKHLVADGRFDYVETGSLVSIRKNVREIVIPSEEDRLELNPMDFEEYLWACGHDLYAEEVRRAWERLSSLPDAVHAKLMRLFNEYMVVGGMPQSVEAFVEERDFEPCEHVKRRTLRLYLDDIAKFGGVDSRRARAIFQAIPGQLSGASKRFKFSSLGGGARYDSCETALDWLADAHLANLCRLCTDPSVGLRMSEAASSLKCYMVDTGLLVSHAFSDGPESIRVQRDLQLGRISTNRGMLVENVVAQQLRASGRSLFYHTWEEPPVSEGGRPRPREVDFLLTRGFADAAGKPRVCPVEVKSTKSYSTVSLDDFADRYGSRVGNQVVLHPKQLRRDGNRWYLPLYMAHCL